MEPGSLNHTLSVFPSVVLSTKVVAVVFAFFFVIVYNRTPDHLAYLEGQQSKGTEASAQSVVKLTRFGEPLYIMELDWTL